MYTQKSTNLCVNITYSICFPDTRLILTRFPPTFGGDGSSTETGHGIFDLEGEHQVFHFTISTWGFPDGVLKFSNGLSDNPADYVGDKTLLWVWISATDSNFDFLFVGGPVRHHRSEAALLTSRLNLSIPYSWFKTSPDISMRSIF